MHIEPFMPGGAVKPFDVRILRWFARLNVQQRYLLLICPFN